MPNESEVTSPHVDQDPIAVEAYLEKFEAADVMTKGEMPREMKQLSSGENLLRKRERHGLDQVHRIELVKRSLLFRIAAAWVITVPFADTLAAMLFFMIRGIMLP